MKKNIFLIIIFAMFSSIYAEKVGTITEVVNPFLMEVEDQQMYIVEGPTIYIYSLKDYKLQKKFGKAGEGPREFRVHPATNMGSVTIEVYPGYILVNSLGRLSFFTRDGEYIKEMISTIAFSVFKPLGKKFVGYGTAVENNIEYRTLKIYNSKLNESKEIFRQKLFYSIPNRYFNLLEAIGPLFYVCDNKIFIEKEKNSISVFDNKGKFLYSIDINKGYKKLEFTTEDEKKYLDYLEHDRIARNFFSDAKKIIKFPKKFPGIRFFHIEAEKIYIIRWKAKNGKSDIWVFDLKGNFLKRVWMTFFEKDAMLPYAYSINNGKLYQLVENEDTEKWELHITEIN